MYDRKSQPALLVVILTLLGISALPKVIPSESPATKPSSAKAGSGAGRKDLESSASSKHPKNPDLAALGPLIDLADDGSARRIEERDKAPSFNMSGRESLVREVVDEIRSQGGTVRGMTALLPDPVYTSVSQDFDSTLDGLQRAAEAAGFVLARSSFPWDETGKAEKPSAETPRDAEIKILLPDEAEFEKGVGAMAKLSYGKPQSWSPKPDDQLGLLVFRNQYDVTVNGRTEKRQAVLVVFLVLKSPTRGLRKHQFNWSLDLLDAFANVEDAKKRDETPRTIRIVGPTYTSTQTSLNHALNSWLTHMPSERLPGAPPCPPCLQRG